MIEHPKIHTLPEFYLSQAALSFNSVCNAKCKFCCGRLTDEPYMSIEKAKEVMHTVLKEFRIKDVYPTCSAELTLYPHLLELIEYTDSLNVPYARITQDTNGRFIPKGFIETLNSVKCFWTISISCWGYDEESWNKNQGNGNWDLFVNNVKRYLTELKIPPPFSMVSMNNEQRDKTLDFIKNICNECGYEIKVLNDARSSFFKSIKENKIVPVAIRNFRAPENFELSGVSYVHPNENPDIVKPFVNFNNCNFAYSSIIMDSAGYVYPCLSLNGKREYAIGNVYDYSPFNKKALVEMIHSEKGIEFWKNNVEKGKFACDICQTCTTRCAY